MVLHATRSVLRSLRYQKKMRDGGFCPHCGRVCAPYKECPERRRQKHESYIRSRAA